MSNHTPKGPILQHSRLWFGAGPHTTTMEELKDTEKQELALPKGWHLPDLNST